MCDFEIIYQIDPAREAHHAREKHPSIELSDEEYIRRKEVITLHNEPPSIPMNLEMPILEETIKKGKKNEQSKIKSTKGKPKKTNPKSNKAAVANI